MNYDNHVDFIRDSFRQRKETNPSYSLRAFSRDLNMAPSTLSQVLSHKKGLSQESSLRIACSLNLTKEETEWFVTSVNAKHGRSSKVKELYQKKLNSIRANQNYNEVSLEYFTVISKWYHYAILELTHIESFIYDSSWIADALSIELSEAEEGIKRLLKLELAEEVDGTLIDTFHNLATTNDIPSISLKNFNSSLMQKAQQALTSQPVAEREISSNIIAIAKSDLPELKERIRVFRRNIDNNLSANKDSVYCLSIQLFGLLKEDL